MDHAWTGSWVNGLFTFHHFHATAHEVLGILGGWCDVQLGGPQGPVLRIEAGDVVVLPAGTGHKNVKQDPAFSCLGAYPLGQSPDQQREVEDPAAWHEGIAQLSLPAQDPALGGPGALLELWGGA